MNDNLQQFLGALHWLALFAFSFYGLLLNKNRFDKVYLIITVLWLISINLLKGECWWSYLIKVYKNSNYEAGSNIMNLDDMNLNNDFFKKILDKHSSNIFLTFFVIYSYSLYIVSRRIGFNSLFPLILSILLLANMLFYRTTIDNEYLHTILRYGFVIIFSWFGINIIKK